MKICWTRTWGEEIKRKQEEDEEEEEKGKKEKGERR